MAYPNGQLNYRRFTPTGVLITATYYKAITVKQPLDVSGDQLWPFAGYALRSMRLVPAKSKSQIRKAFWGLYWQWLALKSKMYAIKFG